MLIFETRGGLHQPLACPPYENRRARARVKGYRRKTGHREAETDSRVAGDRGDVPLPLLSAALGGYSVDACPPLLALPISFYAAAKGVAGPGQGEVF